MKKTLFVVAKVPRDPKLDWELLGVFNDTKKIQDAFGKVCNTKTYNIGYGEVSLNEPLPINYTKWPTFKWMK